MTTRYYEITECVHGEEAECDEPRIVSRDEDGGYVTEFCPGGQRRELTDAQVSTMWVGEPWESRCLIIPLEEPADG